MIVNLVNKYKKIVFIVLFLVSIFSFSSASADIFDDPLGTLQNPSSKISDPGSAIKLVYNLIITVAQIAFIILFLVGGVMYMTSGGNEEQAKKARELLIQAVIGIVIVFAAWGIGNWIINALK